MTIVASNCLIHWVYGIHRPKLQALKAVGMSCSTKRIRSRRNLLLVQEDPITLSNTGLVTGRQGHGEWGMVVLVLPWNRPILPHSARRKDSSYPKGIAGWAEE